MTSSPRIMELHAMEHIRINTYVGLPTPKLHRSVAGRLTVSDTTKLSGPKPLPAKRGNTDSGCRLRGAGVRKSARYFC